MAETTGDKRSTISGAMLRALLALLLFVVTMLTTTSRLLRATQHLDSVTSSPNTMTAVSFNNTGSCKHSRPFCERTGNCLVVDVSDSREHYLDYPRLISAKVDLQKVDKLDKGLLRAKHLRVRTIELFLSGCGFFTFPLIVMNQLLVAKRHGLIGEKKPIVYLPEEHHYWDCNATHDFWEQWFEPVAVCNLSWRDVDESDVWEFSQNSIKTIYYDYRNIKAYPYNGKKDYGTPQWIAVNRARAYPVVKEFIRVRPELVEQSEARFSQLVGGKPVLGLHMRGTDKFVTRKVEVSNYMYQADRFLRYHEDGLLFVATDDKGYLRRMRQRYGEKIVFLTAMRENGNVLYNDKVDKNSKSLEALMDMLSLTWADAIVKGWSGVSEFSLYLRQTRENAQDFNRVVDLQLFDSEKYPLTETKRGIVQSLYEGPINDDELTRVQYLPDELFATDFALSEVLVRDLESELDAITSADCRGPAIQPNVCEWGFGSALNSIVKAAMHALRYGYCLKDPVGWTKYKCENTTRLFAPLASAASPRKEMEIAIEMPLSNFSDPTSCVEVFHTPFELDETGAPLFFYSDKYKKCMMHYSFGRHGNKMLPPSHRSIGFFASVSLILRYIFRPSPALATRLEQEKKAIKWPSVGSPVLGIHYRAGDSCLEEVHALGRKCEGFDVTMKEADRLQQKYGFRHIFLATDDDSVFNELEKYSNWTFHFIEGIDRGGLRKVKLIDELLKEGSINGCREAFECSMDIFLLAQCSAFIGKFSSNIDRLAYNLMFAGAGRHLPHVSMDNEWCFDYGLTSRPLAHSYGEEVEEYTSYYC